MSIDNVRNAENDYAALNEIVEKLYDFSDNSLTLTDNETHIVNTALKAFEKIKYRVYNEAIMLTKQYIKTI